ncbi:MAG: hypothetical protein K9H49_03010 [Bacteroidales bacterium]|nr:hypothetical protein [Bacteroidales bacterium]MCF8389228.1 hypothetical protein [Bacteroidales bacterium]
MNSIRRIILILSISLILVAAVLGILWLRTESFTDNNPGDFIPESFILCLKTDNLLKIEESITERNEIWKEFKLNEKYTNFHKFDKFLIDFDSLRNMNKELEVLFTNDAFISVHKISDRYEFLASFGCHGIKATDVLVKVIGKGRQVLKSKFENQTVYQIENAEEDIFPDLFFYEFKGAFAVSSSLELIKESVRASGAEEKTFESPAYKRIIETAGKDVPANVYINYTELSKLTGKVLESDLLIPLNELFTASVLDLEIYPDKLILNGFTSFENSKSSTYLHFKMPELKGKSLYHLFPSGPVYFSEMKGQPSLLNAEVKSEAEKLFVSGFEKLSKSNSASLICKRGEDYSKYAFVSLISGGNMWDFLTNEAKEILGSEYSPEIKEIRIGEKIFPFATIHSNTILEMIGFNPDTEYGAFIIYDNSLIFAETQNDILYLIQQNELGNNLSNDRSFNNLSDNFASNSNVFSYVNPATYLDYLTLNLRPDALKFITETRDSWSKFNALSFQSTRSDSLHYFRVFLNYTGVRSETVNTVWKRKLDTISVFKPAIVRNYNNKDKEIFIQDEDRNVYLIGNSGDILWKIKSDGPIISDIIQVDYYNNGKLQYLFNTVKKLYLIDRNGNSVEKFPIEFIADATAGNSLFDYDNSGDWRISLPLSNKQIVMYDRSGNVVSGWKFRTTDHIINKSVVHTKIEDKDFIIAKDSYQIYFLDRKGKKRIKPERQIHFSDRNQVFIDKTSGTGKEKVIASDEKGSVFYFYFNEKVEKVMDNDFRADHFFLAENIVGDRKKEFIFTNDNELLVYNSDKDLLFSATIPETINSQPVVYEFSTNDKKIGLVATKTGKIYLYNSDGTLYNGFPLNGSALFSISSFPGLKDRFNLLVSNKDNFLYNYSVK